MAEPFIGEIRMFAGSFAPNGWALCQGQTLSISENDALFNLIGTTYGGDGQETFQLPDLRSRVPIHQGNNFILGENGGVESVTLSVQQIPAHTHPLVTTTSIATQSSPANNVLAQSSAADLYIEDSPTTSLAPSSIGPSGGTQPHDNMQPFLGINYIIALFGIYPSPS